MLLCATWYIASFCLSLHFSPVYLLASTSGVVTLFSVVRRPICSAVFSFGFSSFSHPDSFIVPFDTGGATTVGGVVTNPGLVATFVFIGITISVYMFTLGPADPVTEVPATPPVTFPDFMRGRVRLWVAPSRHVPRHDRLSSVVSTPGMWSAVPPELITPCTGPDTAVAGLVHVYPVGGGEARRGT